MDDSIGNKDVDKRNENGAFMMGENFCYERIFVIKFWKRKSSGVTL